MIVNPRKRRHGLTDEQRQELETVDLLVMDRPVDNPGKDLREMVTAIRAARPVADQGFKVSLDDRAANGFTSGSLRHERPAAKRRRSSSLAPALASVTSIAAVLAIGVGTGAIDFAPEHLASKQSARAGEEEQLLDRNSVTDNSAQPASPFTDLRATEAVSGRAGAYSGPVRSAPHAARTRKIERSGFLTLAAPAAEIEDVADAVVRTTDQFGGYVVTSNVTGGAASSARASFDLQLPTSRFTEALAAYSKLAHVRARNQGTQDITSQFDRNRRRLSELEAERRGLLRQLSASTTTGQTSEIRQRLRDVGGKIESVRTRRASLVNRVEFVRLALNIDVGRGAAKADGPFDKAFDRGGDVLAAVLSGLLVALAVLMPLGLILAAGWLVASRRTRRHRTAALGEND